MNLNYNVLGIVICGLNQNDANNFRILSKQCIVHNIWLQNKYISLSRYATDQQLIEIIESGMKITGLNLSNCNEITDYSLCYIHKLQYLTKLNLTEHRNINDVNLLHLLHIDILI